MKTSFKFSVFSFQCWMGLLLALNVWTAGAQGVTSIGGGAPVFGTATGGSGSGISLSGITGAYQTNILVYPVTVQTNIIYFQSSSFAGINNTNFYWNSTIGNYTNNQGTVWYSVHWDAGYNGGGFVVLSNTTTFSAGANFVRGDQGGSSPDISTAFGVASSYWANFAGAADANMVCYGSITNTATNSYVIFQVPVQFNLTTNLENYEIAADVLGRQLAKNQYNSNSIYSFVAPRYVVVSNASYLVTKNTNGGSGLPAYFANVESPLNTLNSGELRFAVAVATLFGTNGYLGGKLEFLQQRDKDFNDSPQQAGTVFWHPLNLNPDGSIALGNNPLGEHTLFYLFTNGWAIFRSSTLTRPQVYFEPSPDPTNWLISGQMWNRSNSVTTNLMIVQNGITGVAMSSKYTFSETNATCPLPLPYGGFLWNSNKVLYWVTNTKTNLISNGQ